FAAGISTNLTRDHLDYHKTPAKYKAAKAKLFEQLGPKGLAVINADDPAAAFMKEHSKGRVVTYGLQNAADVTATVEHSGAAGMRMRLKLGAEELPVSSRL